MNGKRGHRGANRGRGVQAPDWQIAIVDGQPEMVINGALLRELVKISPLGRVEARRRLLAGGVPADVLAEPDDAA